MNTIEALNVEGNLPSFFREFYPKFITLMENYFDWLRKSGLTMGEITDLIDTDDWIQDDFDEFLKSGDLKYLNFDEESYKQLAIIQQSKPLLRNSAKDMLKETVMERQEEVISTQDGSLFVCKPDGVFMDDGERQLTATYRNDEVIKQHYYKFGFPWTNNTDILNFDYKLTNSGDYVKDSDDRFVLVNNDDTIYKQRTLDHQRFIKLLKYIHAARGTKKGIELFFDTFTGLPIHNVVYPKNQLMVIDGENVEKNHIDGTSVLRDDITWSEFSYIIQLSGTDTLYEFAFENIYLPYFHPAGFNVSIERV